MYKEYIKAVKRGLRDQHGFKVIGGSEEEPLLDAPDGEYPITVQGKIDRVVVQNGTIDCGNFDK